MQTMADYAQRVSASPPPALALRPFSNVINGECLSSVLDMSLRVVCCRLSLPHLGGESLNRLPGTERPFEGENMGAEKDDGP